MKYTVRTIMPGCQPGPHLDNHGQGYASRAAALAAADRRGLIPVDIWELGETLPDWNDAQGWDRIRMRAGCPSR